MGMITITDNTGDVEIRWDANLPAEVENARKSFNEMLKKGYLAYDVSEKRKIQMHDFDGSIEHIVMTPARAGG